MYPSQGQVWKLGKLRERRFGFNQFGFNSQPSPCPWHRDDLNGLDPEELTFFTST